MSRRVLVLDYGSNSLRWLLADVLPGGPLAPLAVGGRTTRLGGSRDGAIDDEALQAALAATAQALDWGERHGAEVIKACATHFARRLGGVGKLVEALKQRHGLRLHILSGPEEAFLTRVGIEEGLRNLELDGREYCCFDVGGGSTELSWWSDGGLRNRSLALGAVGLTDEFLTADPPAFEELTALRNRLRGLLGAVELPVDLAAAAAGGTVTTLAALELGLDGYRPLLVQGARLERTDLERRLDELAGLELVERRRMLALEPRRAEIIVAGTAVVLEVLERLNCDTLLVSDYDLKHGAALVDLEALPRLDG